MRGRYHFYFVSPRGARLRGGRPHFFPKKWGKERAGRGISISPAPAPHPLKRPIGGNCGSPLLDVPPRLFYRRFPAAWGATTPARCLPATVATMIFRRHGTNGGPPRRRVPRGNPGRVSGQHAVPLIRPSVLTGAPSPRRGEGFGRITSTPTGMAVDTRRGRRTPQNGGSGGGCAPHQRRGRAIG